MQEFYAPILPIEVIVAGMTYGVYSTIEEAIEICKAIPGSRIRTALGYNL